MRSEMIIFDEGKLRDRLATLPIEGAVTFAACCAERLMPSLIHYANLNKAFDRDCYLNGMELMWLAAAGQHIERKKLELFEKQCVVPTEDQSWEFGEPYAEDAAAAVIYTIQTWLLNKREYAAFAARRAYEVVDHVITGHMENFPNLESEELAVLSHPSLQRELERQQSDLAKIEACGIALTENIVCKLRDKAKNDSASVLNLS